jgi:hypothetical protein
MEDSTWDFLLYPSLRETEQIGVSFEFVSPAIIQLFLSWKKKTQKKHGAWGNTERFEELEQSKTHPRLTYATGRNHSLDGLETESLGGELVVGFLHMVTGTCWGGGVFGMEVFLCWFGLSIAHCSEAFGGVGVVGSLVSWLSWGCEIANFGGFYHLWRDRHAWFHTRGRKDMDIREFYQGLEHFLYFGHYFDKGRKDVWGFW